MKETKLNTQWVEGAVARLEVRSAAQRDEEEDRTGRNLMNFNQAMQRLSRGPAPQSRTGGRAPQHPGEQKRAVCQQWKPAECWAALARTELASWGKRELLLLAVTRLSREYYDQFWALTVQEGYCKNETCSLWQLYWIAWCARRGWEPCLRQAEKAPGGAHCCPQLPSERLWCLGGRSRCGILFLGAH